MDALLELIVLLAASNGKVVESCLEMLVNNNFTPPYSFTNMLNQPRGIARKDQVLSRVHSALEHIADLVPLVPMKLLPIVIKRKPHYNSQEQVLLVYVENMLRLEGGAFGKLVRSTMLSGVVDLLLDLDVQIGHDENLQDDWAREIFKMELEDAAETTDEESKDCTELPRELSRKSLGGNQFAESLDSLMELTYEHLEACEVSGRLIEVFETPLESFRKTVQPTYKSKFSQFVMFYACALDPEHCGTRFSTMLTDILVYSVYPLSRLVDWCFEYCKMQNGEIDPKAHRIFYSGCQAIMYVLCFCMRSLMTIPRFRSQLLSLPIGIILSHSLCPLKVCLASVVNEFLLQAKAARLFTPSEQFDFDNHMESELSIAFGGSEERLDIFFPCDPYLLKKSDRFIRPNFVYLSIVNPIYDDDEACSSDEEVAEATMNDGMSRKFEDLDLDEFDSALNKMSITPNDSLRYRCGGSLRDLVRMPSRVRASTSPESL